MKKSFIYIIFAGILWGTSGLFVHCMLPLGLTTLNMATIRGGVAALCMVCYALLFKRELFKITLSEGALFFLSGLAMYLTSYTYYSSIKEASVSTAVILMYTAPVIVMAYSVCFLGEKFTFKKGVSLALMLVGCALVSGVAGGMKFSFLGILFGIGAGVSYSAYNIFTKIQMRKKSNPASATMYCFVFMALCSLVPASPINILNIAVHNAPWSFVLMAGCGILTSVLPYFFYTLALKKLPVGTASSLSIIEPVSATVLSVAFLGEKLTVYSLVGIVLVLGAVVILNTDKTAS